MIAAGAAQKLRFTVAYCSGEDYDYPVRELLFHSPQTRGWQSPRTCKYPQEVILQLEQPSCIQQIQILSHEYKIATKVEVFVGEQNIRDPGYSPASMKRLGYLSFDSNERSGHQARELKSVAVNVNALIIKFIIHRCHLNKLNIYNQVGVIAVNLIGEVLPPVPSGPPGYLEVAAAPASKQPYYNKAAAAVADLNLDLHVDQHTAAKIRDLQRQKEAAIEAEDYDEAKRLKVSIERLNVIGQKIQQLEGRKRAAVEKEDYDLAKLLKADIEKLRMAGDSAAVAGDGAALRSKNPEDIFNRVLEKDRSSSNSGGAQAAAAAPRDRASDSGWPAAAQLSGSFPAVQSPQDEPRGSINGDTYPSPSAGMQPPSGPSDWPSDNPTSYISYDERPTNGRGTYNVDASAADPAAITPSRPPRNAMSSEEQVVGAKPPAGWPDGLPGPEVLAGPAAAQAGEVVELVGEYAGTAFFSKNWQLRDASAAYMADLVKQGRLADRKDAYRTLVKAVVRGLKDRVPNVFHGSVQLLLEVLTAFASTVSARELASAAEQCLPVLLDKVGDANTRIKEAAKGAIMELAGVKDAGLRGMTSAFVRPVKNQTAWKPVLGTLQLLQDLVPLLGISKTGDGFELGELMDYVGGALNSPNVEVRSAAVRVAAACHELVGPPVRRFLPRDLNPKIKEQLDQAFGGDAASPGAPTQGRPPSATAPNSTAKGPHPASKASAAAPKSNNHHANPPQAAPKASNQHHPNAVKHPPPAPPPPRPGHAGVVRGRDPAARAAAGRQPPRGRGAVRAPGYPAQPGRQHGACAAAVRARTADLRAALRPRAPRRRAHAHGPRGPAPGAGPGRGGAAAAGACPAHPGEAAGARAPRRGGHQGRPQQRRLTPHRLSPPP